MIVGVHRSHKQAAHLAASHLAEWDPDKWSVHHGGAITIAAMALEVLPQRRRLCTADLYPTSCIHAVNQTNLWGIL